MYPCTNFQLIWRASDFGTKFAQKNMNDKNFEKIKIKIVISIHQYVPLYQISVNLEKILGLNLPQKHFRVEY